MINLTKNPDQNGAALCLRRELAAEIKAGATATTESGFGAEIIQLITVSSGDPTQLRAARRIEASLRYMMQHLNQPVRVPALSAMVGLSESSFFALFKSATGLTPLDFFIRARMQRAGALLAETPLQIKEIAARLGYDDQFYFSRLFKSVHGVSPREYRARQEAANGSRFKSHPDNASAVVAGRPTEPSRLSAAGGTELRQRVVLGVFQPAVQSRKTFPADRRAGAASAGSTCPISIP
jgi:AraC-like DNA-binding protein